MKKDYKALAERYFDGKITPEEETILAEYLRQGDEARAAFRKWHQEWAARPHFDMPTERAWQRFAVWMMDHQPKDRRSPWYRVAVAAAVVTVLVCSALAAWYVYAQPAERYYAVTAPMGSKTSLSLPDGSQVWLNAGSTLRYSTRFDDRNRRVSLDGEAYFSVTKHDGARFVVSTRGYDVEVRGTKFDVSAYKDDPYITTNLIEGAVLISRDDDQLSMKPGEMVRLDTRTGELTKSRSTADARAWVQNMAEYGDITLGELSRLLSRRYAVHISIASERLSRMRFSISLRNMETIDDVFGALQRITAMKVRREGKNIYVTE